MRASGKQLEAKLAAAHQALAGAKHVAAAYRGVLRQLLKGGGGREACALIEQAQHEDGENEDEEAAQAWAERAGRALSDWMDEQRRQHASTCLVEEQLRAELRAAKSEAEGSRTDAHARAERAEARCRHLVAALRATQRGVVDAVQGDMPMVAGGHEPGAGAYYDMDVPARVGAGASDSSEQAALRRRHRTAVWERQRTWAYQEAAQREAARGSAAAKVRDHLLVPVMRAQSQPGRT